MDTIDYTRFVEALASEGQPETAFEAMWRLTGSTVGVKLFTLMSFDRQAGVAERFYSNMPEAYPVSGTKPMNMTKWADHVLEKKRVFVANDIEGIAEVFFDHELIRSLGCESVINIPVVIDDEVAGTINCLHQAGHYSDSRVRIAEQLKLPGAACFLLRQNKQATGAA